MTSEHETGRSGLGREQARWIGPARLAIGLGWGVALWWLWQSTGYGDAMRWPASQPPLFGPLLLAFGYTPVLMLAGVGRLRWRTWIVWTLAASVVLAFLGWHDVVRQALGAMHGPPWLSPPMLGFIAAALFIAHHLIAPADTERRWIASYPVYFDTAWKAGVQLALSLGFTGAFWLLLFLGSALFQIIGLTFLSELITKAWFGWPVSGLVFAVAVHLTDVRDGLIRGVRTVVLMLLSWLLLLITVLVAAFLIALPSTGLNGLWDTGSATALVLAAAGILIVLINTAYQDGRADNLPPVVLRIAVRVASVLVTPLIGIAVWGLMLRVGQHGLTPDRIIAAACALVGVVYALGYGLGAVVPLFRLGSAWMKALELTNVVAAVLSVCVILALFSPLADPARLSVADQVKRLEAGKVTPETFDYAFLKFGSGQAGVHALSRLAASKNPVVSANATKVQSTSSRAETAAIANVTLITPTVEIWPAGSVLPPDFAPTGTYTDARRNCRPDETCVATSRDLDGDGQAEILLAQRYGISLFARSQGKWMQQGDYPLAGCPGEVGINDPRELIKGNQWRPINARWPALDLGSRLPARLNGSGLCEEVAPDH